MQGFTNSITGVIRQNGEAGNSVPFKRTVYLNLTCIRVQRAWLTLTSALLLLTLISSMGIMVQSRRYEPNGAKKGGRGAWKSSSLPSLWCGVKSDSIVVLRLGKANLYLYCPLCRPSLVTINQAQ